MSPREVGGEVIPKDRQRIRELSPCRPHSGIRALVPSSYHIKDGIRRISTSYSRSVPPLLLGRLPSSHRGRGVQVSALRRTDLQARAQSITESAILLVKNHRWSDAYYLAGYAVELGLKACIAKQLSPETIPDKEFLKNILKHEFDLLIGLAGLRQELKEELRGDSVFAANWAIVGEWSTRSEERRV